LECPNFSATKSGVSLPPKVSLARFPSIASYTVKGKSSSYIKITIEVSTCFVVVFGSIGNNSNGLKKVHLCIVLISKGYTFFFHVLLYVYLFLSRRACLYMYIVPPNQNMI
jgi:hypothetical protein